jgi:hypothetical protein
VKGLAERDLAGGKGTAGEAELGSIATGKRKQKPQIFEGNTGRNQKFESQPKPK